MAIQKIPNTLIADNAVTAAKIANGSLTADDISNNSITAAKLSASTSPTFGGLTVEGTNGTFAIAADGNTVSMSRAGSNYVYASNASGDLFLGAGGNASFLKIDNIGDISFYEDTGTTAKFFWDASAESLGIGTTSPDFSLDIEAASSGVQLQIGRTVTNVGSTWMGADSNGFHLGVGAYGAGNAVSDPNGFTVDTSGNVGVGIASPTLVSGKIVHIHGTAAGVHLTDTASGTTSGDGAYFVFDNPNLYIQQKEAGPMIFETAGTERMRIGPTGGLEVGDGTYYGYLKVISDDAVTGVFDRRNGSGTLLQFRLNDSTIGSLNIQSSTLQIGTGNTQLAFSDADDAFFVKNEAGANRDGSHDLGKSSARFKDIYLSGGVNFSANSNASGMTSETLDDYEEGTWTPACGATLATAVGHYTKIGNQVTVYYHLVTTGGLPTSTSQVIITGLPFTSNSGSLVAAPIYSRYYTPNDSSLTSLIQDSETQIRLMNINDQSFDYTIWGELEASANNSVYIIGSATYMV